MNWFDLVLLGLVLIYAAGGFRQGLVKQLFNLCGFFIILGLAVAGSRVLSGPVSAFLDPEKILQHHQVIQLPGAEAVVEGGVNLAAGLIVFVALFVVLLILFRFVSRGFRWINRLPVVGLINRLGGALVGLTLGVVFAFLLITAVSLIPLPLFNEIARGSKLVALVGEMPALAAGIQEYLIQFYLELPADKGA